MLLGFLYRFALRASEAASLRTDAVNVGRAEVRVRGAKAGLERIYTLPVDLGRLARKWKPAGPYYFGGRAGSVSRIRVWQIGGDAMRAAGIPRGFSPHSLRHSVAVHALDAGLQLEEVRDLLRHQRMASAEIYGTISTRRRNDYLRRLSESDAIVKLGGLPVSY